MKATFKRVAASSFAAFSIFIAVILVEYYTVVVTFAPDEVMSFTLPEAKGVITYGEKEGIVDYIQYSVNIEYPVPDAAISLDRRFSDKQWVRYRGLESINLFQDFDVYNCNMISGKRLGCWRIDHYINDQRNLVAQVEYWYFSPTREPLPSGLKPDNDKLHIVMRAHPSYDYSAVEMIARICNFTCLC